MAWSLAFFGAAVQGYGPPAVAVAYWLRRNPQLQIVALFSSLIGIFTLYPVALVFIGAKDSAPGAYVVLQAIIKEVCRALLCYALLSGEKIFRTHTQVMHSSRFRLVMLGAGIGFGLAVAQTVLIFGATIEAYNRVSGGNGVEMYDPAACPGLPFAFFQAIQSNLAFVFEVTASMIVLPAVAGIRGLGVRRQGNNNNARSSLVEGAVGSPTMTGGGSINNVGGSSAYEAMTIKQQPGQEEELRDEEQQVRQLDEYEEGAKRALQKRRDARKKKKEAQQKFDPSIPPKAGTTFTRAKGLGFLLVVTCLHVLFSALSLVNSKAIDWEDYSKQVSGRGCGISIPIQVLVVCGMLALTAGVAKAEAVSREDDGHFEDFDSLCPPMEAPKPNSPAADRIGHNDSVKNSM